MESGPLSTKEFKEFAEDVVLFCHITARIPGRKHDGLLSEKGGNGFPYLVFMDAEGNVLNKPAGRSVAAFQKGAEQASAFCALRAKDSRSPAEEVELLTLEIEFGTVSAADAKTRADGLTDLDEGTRAKLDEAMAELARRDFDKEMMKILESKGQPRSEEDLKKLILEVGPQFWTFYQDGKRTSSDQQAAQTFYTILARYGLEASEAGPARAGYDGLVEHFGSNPRTKGQLDQMKAKVEALEGK